MASIPPVKGRTRTLLSIAALGVAVLLLLILTAGAFVTIDGGQKGVLFRKFSGGIDKEKIFGQGFHVVAPWNNMYRYDVRIREIFEQLDVLANNGLNIHVELSVLYRVQPDKVGFLHDEIGPNFENSILIPEIRSATRSVIGQYGPEELYSSKREAIQTEMFELMEKALANKYVIVDAVLIRGVQLPEKIRDAIERKLEQEQESQQYLFRIEKERKEAERKRIEAQGIKDFQDIVSQGISDKLLRWKGIEATLDVAKSNNTKIVIIGGKDGLPVILNDK